MKKLGYVILFYCGLLLTFACSSFSADTKPSSQVTWERTLAAAKKEGKLNFYVGRYGTERLSKAMLLGAVRALILDEAESPRAGDLTRHVAELVEIFLRGARR